MEKSTNAFQIEKNRLSDYLFDNYYLWREGSERKGKIERKGGNSGGDMYKAIAIQVEPRIKNI